MHGVINIEKSFGKFQDTFSPQIVGELNGQNVMLVRCEGDKVPWHAHTGEDEIFLVWEGTLRVMERDKSVTLHTGEFCIVPRGIEHRVVPEGHVKLILFEPVGISHTGDVKAEITKERFDRLEG
ncbi:MAG: cupin domain-containing protein [Candidatus Krumholzibacteriota bacterium]|nr:cupin domain-containing protein [Candidatus Krumholzibacteriota bacterium]